MGLESQILRGIKNIQKAQKFIPPDVLKAAKGLVVVSEAKGAFLFSGSIARGFVISRKDDGTWGFPASLMSVGMGIGGQIGGELIDIVLVIMNESVLNALKSKLQLKVGVDASVAIGPIGGEATIGGAVGSKGAASIFSYSMAKGVFAGVSIDGSIFTVNNSVNKKFYRGRYALEDIFNGNVPLEGLAINGIQTLQAALYDMEHGEYGRQTFTVLPVDDVEYTEVREQRKEYETTRSQRGIITDSAHTMDTDAVGEASLVRASSSSARLGNSTTPVESEQDIKSLKQPQRSKSQNLRQNSKMSSKNLARNNSSTNSANASGHSMYTEGLMNQQKIDSNDPDWFAKRRDLGPTLEVFADHVVDERDPAVSDHFIISVRKGDIVKLVDGDYRVGLPAPYSEYISVYCPLTRKSGRISRFVVRPYTAKSS